MNIRLTFLFIIMIIQSGCVYRPWIEIDDVVDYVSQKPLTSIAVHPRSNIRSSHRVGTEVLPSPVLVYNSEVRHEIENFLKRDPRYIPEALKRRQDYLPMLEKVFIEEGLPMELLNVALVESGFKSKARSGAGAVGMWQFMKSTGKMYGLKIKGLSDQRKDPYLSTIAAARHLKDLYIDHRDWHLALAAYNAGPAGLKRGLKKAGTSSFWVASRKKTLGRETRRYVPKIIAATIIVNNLEEYGYGELARNLGLNKVDRAERKVEQHLFSGRTGYRLSSAG